LDKHDFALAAQTFQEGLKKHPADPDLHLGLARAYKPSDRTLMLASAETALKLNTNHVPSLLLLGDHWIDAEDYAAADKLLARVLAVNPWHPEAWAYRALLARLRNKPAEEQAARESALRFWKTNPRVDHLIGLKLSQKYRFAEGASCQRQSLHLDKDYLLAKAQLATDLLRLGEEAQGWSLAEEVHAKDGYDVAAYNLVTLRQTMAKFNTITNQDFILRMNAHEAQVYSQLVLESLARAKNQLCAKYSLELEHPAIIEIFPEQKDFSVRTFGLPENPGYLGVCFGRVITMTSPAAHPGHPINWEAVLWHEFCHVVTLQLSRNRMPRWLSEGLSVYEERLANPAWGQRMSWRHRQMILQGELAPVSRLSAAFLAPRSDAHLQFAYYQSSLVVEYLMQRFGLAPLRAILQDLGQGMEINPAIEKHTAPMATIEKDFDRFARQQAEKLAPGLDWERLGIEAALGDADELWSKWAKARPNNFWALTRQAEKLIEEKRWQEAKAPLQKLIELYPANTGPDNAYRMLAMACRALDETDQERLVLGQWAERDAVATDAYLRLMELSARAKDWPAVVQNARRFIAVNPLIAPPYHYLAKAGESLGETRQAIEAYRTLLRLDPPQPVEIHFRLASLLRRVGDPAARRHVLMALEDAPRHRAALRLLLELNGEMPGEDAGPATKLEGQR
jgi:tetratricopeptide (TPR) repeat protein